LTGKHVRPRHGDADASARRWVTRSMYPDMAPPKSRGMLRREARASDGMAEPQGEDPFDAGVEAFDRGLSRSDCPYPEGSHKREAWLDGWDRRVAFEERSEPDDI